MDELLTPREVATYFGVNPKTVTRWAVAGKLPSFRTVGGHRRFRRVDIESFAGHSYMSTACLHAEHERCRLTCKFCEAPCVCECHK